MPKNAILEYRDLILELIKHELKNKYRESILGFIWYVLEPLILMLILIFVFKIILGSTIEHFEIWILIGIEIYRFFQIGTSTSLNSVLVNAHLIKKIYFPREILPIYSSFVALIIFLVEFCILIILMIVLHVTLQITILIIPILISLEFMIILGIGFFLAALNTKYRDLYIIWGLIIQILFWFSPIIYDLSLVPANLQIFVLINPLSPLIISFREIILFGTIPNALYFIYLLILGFILLFSGYYFYKWRAKKFAEEI